MYAIHFRWHSLLTVFAGYALGLHAASRTLGFAKNKLCDSDANNIVGVIKAVMLVNELMNFWVRWISFCENLNLL